jgi:hypothetical protein
MLINRTRADLSPDQYQELGRLAQGFYDHMPPGVKLLGDWAATDRSRTFTLLEVDDPSLLAQIEAPFRPYVDIETSEVAAVTAWGGR